MTPDEFDAANLPLEARITANMPNTLVTDRDTLREAVEAAWKGRAAAQGWKHGTATYLKHEVEFFTGAMAALNATFPHREADKISPYVPVMWVIHGLSGRPIVGAPKPQRKPPPTDGSASRRAEDGYVGA